MHIFYAPGLEGNEYILDEKESLHGVRVLRLKEGNRVRLIDGRGGLYEAVITDADPRECRLRIISATSDYETRSYNLHIAISPLKNYERFEWFIEKSVEIGIDEITPVICVNTEKPGIKKERVSNLIISAMKQSIKSTLTRVNDPCNFMDFIAVPRGGVKMIAHCNVESARSAIKEIYSRGNDAIILIGPEGDFSTDEIRSAEAAGYLPVHLGKSRLRSETAGVAACYSVYFINQ